MDRIKICISRLCLKLFWFIPIRENFIFLSSYEGKQFSCSPKTIYEYLKKYRKFTFIYEYNDNLIPNDLISNNVICVKHNTLKYIYYIMISKYIITNSGISCCFPLRKKQCNINTWHGGGAYKKVGFEVSDKVNGGDLMRVELASKQTTFFISSSKKFSEIMSSSIRLPINKFLNIGMPRNDVFFDKKLCKNIRNKVREMYEIDENDTIVLYAPTYRGDCGSDMIKEIPFDVKKLALAVKKRFKKDVHIFIRMHYFNENKLGKNNNVVDVSNYSDMQELLIASDILITDYSSSIWDYSFTKKPCFLYVYDKNEYLKDRGVYTPIETWPGVVCETENKLYFNIQNFNKSQYEDHIKKHHELLQSYEIGNATKNLCDNILNLNKIEGE